MARSFQNISKQGEHEPFPANIDNDSVVGLLNVFSDSKL